MKWDRFIEIRAINPQCTSTTKKLFHVEQERIGPSNLELHTPVDD